MKLHGPTMQIRGMLRYVNLFSAYSWSIQDGSRIFKAICGKQVHFCNRLLKKKCPKTALFQSESSSRAVQMALKAAAAVSFFTHFYEHGALLAVTMYGTIANTSC